MAFEEGRVQELNAIIHPAVIEAQRRWMEEIFRTHPRAIAVVESALIFEVERDAQARGERAGLLADWRSRFDCVVAVTAPDALRIERYVAKLAPRELTGEALEAAKERLRADARARIAQQMAQEEKARRADFVLVNDGDEARLNRETEKLWQWLLEFEQRLSNPRSS
jgi:dephospho-CoA kinase